jgi:hypothetical protein
MQSEKAWQPAWIEAQKSQADVVAAQQWVQ